jgi:hypothetical protein
LAGRPCIKTKGDGDAFPCPESGALSGNDSVPIGHPRHSHGASCTEPACCRGIGYLQCRRGLAPETSNIERGTSNVQRRLGGVRSPWRSTLSVGRSMFGVPPRRSAASAASESSRLRLPWPGCTALRPGQNWASGAGIRAILGPYVMSHNLRYVAFWIAPRTTGSCWRLSTGREGRCQQARTARLVRGP